MKCGIKCSGTRKFTLGYQSFEMNFDFEISRADRYVTSYLISWKAQPFLTHCILVDFSTVINWTSLFVILRGPGLFCASILILMENPVSKHCRP